MSKADDSGMAATPGGGAAVSGWRARLGDGEAVRIALFYAALFLIYGVQVPYLPVWLDWKGLTAAEVSMVMAAPFFVRIVVTPVVSLAADARRMHRGAVITVTVLALLAALALSRASGFAAIMAAAVVMLVSASTAMPLAETVAVDAVRRKGLDYGRMRLWGSATFIFASYAGGMAVERWGGGIASSLLIAGAVATVLAAIGLPRQQRVAEAAATVTLAPEAAAAPLSVQPSAAEAVPVGLRPVDPALIGPQTAPRQEGSALAAALRLVRQPLFLVFLVAAGATQASHAMLYTFGALHWRSQGISTTWIGILWAIGVMVEIALFAYAKPVAARIGIMPLMTLGALACVLRWAALATSPPLALLLPLQVLHGLSYGATHVAAIKFIARAVPVAAAGTAQGLYATIAAGVGHGAATLAAGALYPRVGAGGYLAMAALAGVGLVAAVDLWRRWPGAPLWRNAEP